MVQTWHNSISASIGSILHPLTPLYAAHPPILSPPFLFPTLRELHLGLHRPHALQCTVFIFREPSSLFLDPRSLPRRLHLLTPTVTVQLLWAATCSGSVSLSMVHGASQVDTHTAATLVAILLRPVWPSLIGSLLWGMGRPWRWRANWVCVSLSHDSKFGRLWVFGNVVTRSPLWETGMPITKHPGTLTLRWGSRRKLVPAAGIKGQNSLCPPLMHVSSA